MFAISASAAISSGIATVEGSTDEISQDSIPNGQRTGPEKPPGRTHAGNEETETKIIAVGFVRNSNFMNHHHQS
jgi:hypothetical protein